MMQPRPLSPRRTVQLMVILTILAWATQTLFRQWGYGGVVFPTAPAAQSLGEAQLTTDGPQQAATTQLAAPDYSSLTKNVTLSADAGKSEAEASAPATPSGGTADAQATSPATVAAIDAAINPPVAQANAPLVELRCEATIDGSEVTLKQLCRWNDDAQMAKFADVVVARLSQNNPVRQIGLDEIKQSLHDAGANLSQLQFAGSASCAVRRSEVDDATFAKLLNDDAKIEENAAKPQAAPEAETIVADEKQTTLLDLLMTDLSDRLKISQDVLDVQFDVRGQADLLLTSPRCRFDIDSSRITALGAVSWDVTVHAPRGDHTATIIGKARVWQDQLVLTRPLSAGQKILEQDVTTKRAMVDKFDERPLATDVNQIVGQVLTANMQKGDVVYLPCVKGENLVLKDQFVTVALPHEGLMIETVARSLENGARGETVRVRNEATNQIYSIIVTDKASGEVRISGNEKVAATDR